MAKLGRPLKPIDWKVFEDLCNIQCTPEEIASVCRVDRHTLYDRVVKEYEEDFPTVYKKFTENGKMSLRRIQMKLAQKNTAMAIWLGKQYLNQKDHHEAVEYGKQEDVKLKQNYYAALHKIQTLEEKINGIESKTSQELPRSDAQV